MDAFSHQFLPHIRPLPSLLGLFLVTVQVCGAETGFWGEDRSAVPLGRAAHIPWGPPALLAHPHHPARFRAVFE